MSIGSPFGPSGYGGSSLPMHKGILPFPSCRGRKFSINTCPSVTVRLVEIVITGGPMHRVDCVRVGPNNTFLSPGSIPVSLFHSGSAASKCVEGHTLTIGQQLAIEISMGIPDKTLISCQVKEGSPLPEDYKDIDDIRFGDLSSTLRLLHPGNPKHQYTVAIPWKYEWHLPDWIEATIDDPNSELNGQVIDNCIVHAYAIGNTTDG